MFRKVLANPLNLSLFVLGFIACSYGPKTNLDRLFQDDFRNFAQVSVDTLKAKGQIKKFPHATFEEVWEAAIFVFAQHGILISNLELERGMITAVSILPVAIYVEEDTSITAYLSLIEELNDPIRVDSYSRKKRLKKEEKQRIADELLGLLATQVYSGQKWQYLNRNSPGNEKL